MKYFDGVLQSIAFIVILALALLFDGLIETVGLLCTALIAGMVLALAGVLVWRSNH